MNTAAAIPINARRMALANVTTGPVQRPHLVLIYGPEGVGKSSFGAGAPAPIFLGAEDGTAALDVARFPAPRAWSDILEATDVLMGEHQYKTLVIDSLDWAEPLAWAEVCRAGGKQAIEDFGYGKGYVAAVDLWRGLLARLEKLRAERGMHVVLIAHAAIKKLQNPEGEDYDRHTIKLHEKSAGPIKECVDHILFASWEVLTREADNGKTKGVETGRRILRTVRHAAYDAKSRHGIPASLELEWQAFDEAVRDAQNVGAAVRALLARVDAQVRAKAEQWIAVRHRLPHEMLELRRKLEAVAAESAAAKSNEKTEATKEKK